MGDHFSVREKSENFTQNTGKSGNFDIGKMDKYWKSVGKLAVRKIKTMEMGCHTSNKK